jgi:HK97 family phage prohead protease
MQLKHKSFPVSAFKAVDPEAGIVEAIVAVFNNVDSMNERILPGAFAKSLGRKLPKGVWMHDWNQPVAKTLQATELNAGDTRLPESLRQLGGLYIKGQFNMGTQRGREAFSDIQFGIVDEFSIGYLVEKAVVSNETTVIDLAELELYEWSPVLVGANPATALLSAKGLRVKLSDHSDAVLAAVSEYAARMKKLQAMREKEGRVLSSANREKLSSLKTSLADVIGIIDDLLEASEPAPKDDEKAIIRANWRRRRELEIAPFLRSL